MLEALKQEVWEANLSLVEMKLVLFTWGNVSGRDRNSGLVVIKPSGVSYEALRPEDMVVVNLDGAVVEGLLHPSTDTETHLALYRAYDGLGGVTHTHSTHATAWAQTGLPLPALGTTHADTFYGEIPVTRAMTPAEIAGEYEKNTGHVIVEALGSRDPLHMPAALVLSHGPFTWGKDAKASAHNAAILEEVARMAILVRTVRPDVVPMQKELRDKHFLRKHGPGAYYGQG